jgi:hypothetical protein
MIVKSANHKRRDDEKNSRIRKKPTPVPKLAKKIASAVAEQVSDAEVTASSFAFAAAVELVAEEKVCSSCSYQTEVNWHMAAGRSQGWQAGPGPAKHFKIFYYLKFLI